MKKFIPLLSTLLLKSNDHVDFSFMHSIKHFSCLVGGVYSIKEQSLDLHTGLFANWSKNSILCLFGVEILPVNKSYNISCYMYYFHIAVGAGLDITNKSIWFSIGLYQHPYLANKSNIIRINCSKSCITKSYSLVNTKSTKNNVKNQNIANTQLLQNAANKDKNVSKTLYQRSFLPTDFPILDEKITFLPTDFPILDEKITFLPTDFPILDEKITFLPTDFPILDEKITASTQNSNHNPKKKFNYNITEYDFGPVEEDQIKAFKNSSNQHSNLMQDLSTLNNEISKKYLINSNGYKLLSENEFLANQNQQACIFANQFASNNFQKDKQLYNLDELSQQKATNLAKPQEDTNFQYYTYKRGNPYKNKYEWRSSGNSFLTKNESNSEKEKAREREFLQQKRAFFYTSLNKILASPKKEELYSQEAFLTDQFILDVYKTCKTKKEIQDKLSSNRYFAIQNTIQQEMIDSKSFEAKIQAKGKELASLEKLMQNSQNQFDDPLYIYFATYNYINTTQTLENSLDVIEDLEYEIYCNITSLPDELNKTDAIKETSLSTQNHLLASKLRKTDKKREKHTKKLYFHELFQLSDFVEYNNFSDTLINASNESLPNLLDRSIANQIYYNAIKNIESLRKNIFSMNYLKQNWNQETLKNRLTNLQSIAIKAKEELLKKEQAAEQDFHRTHLIEAWYALRINNLNYIIAKIDHCKKIIEAGQGKDKDAYISLFLNTLIYPIDINYASDHFFMEKNTRIQKNQTTVSQLESVLNAFADNFFLIAKHEPKIKKSGIVKFFNKKLGLKLNAKHLKQNDVLKAFKTKSCKDLEECYEQYLKKIYGKFSSAEELYQTQIGDENSIDQSLKLIKRNFELDDFETFRNDIKNKASRKMLKAFDHHFKKKDNGEIRNLGKNKSLTNALKKFLQHLGNKRARFVVEICPDDLQCVNLQIKTYEFLNKSVNSSKLYPLISKPYNDIMQENTYIQSILKQKHELYKSKYQDQVKAQSLISQAQQQAQSKSSQAQSVLDYLINNYDESQEQLKIILDYSSQLIEFNEFMVDAHCKLINVGPQKKVKASKQGSTFQLRNQNHPIIFLNKYIWHLIKNEQTIGNKELNIASLIKVIKAMEQSKTSASSVILSNLPKEDCENSIIIDQISHLPDYNKDLDYSELINMLEDMEEDNIKTLNDLSQYLQEQDEKDEAYEAVSITLNYQIMRSILSYVKSKCSENKESVQNILSNLNIISDSKYVAQKYMNESHKQNIKNKSSMILNQIINPIKNLLKNNQDHQLYKTFSSTNLTIEEQLAALETYIKSINK